MKIHVLGTGTSTGVPQLLCRCEVCRSADAKDKRLRTSILIEKEGTNVLIDCGPDFRQQLLRTPSIRYISAVLLTHEHYDHVGGLDDVRPFGNVPVYGEKRVLEAVKQLMPYCFTEKLYPGVPILQLHEVEEEEKFTIHNIEIEPLRAYHHNLPVFGYRIGKFAYLTDFNQITETEMEKLKGLDVLIMDALRIKHHLSHLSLREALHIVKRLTPKQTYFVHMSHDMGLHESVNARLPEYMQLAYDCMEITVED